MSIQTPRLPSNMSAGLCDGIGYWGRVDVEPFLDPELSVKKWIRQFLEALGFVRAGIIARLSLDYPEPSTLVPGVTARGHHLRTTKTTIEVLDWAKSK